MDRSCAYLGNPWLGMFVTTNDVVTFIPHDAQPSLAEKAEKYLGTETKPVNVGDSNLIGLYLAMNSNGIILPNIASDEEIENLKKTGMNVYRSGTKLNAHGNNIVINDKGGVVNRNVPPEEVKKMGDALGVELVPCSIAGYSTVGSVCMANNKGFLSHFRTSSEEMGLLSDVLKVPGYMGSVNTGVGFVSYGVVANNNGYITGLNTTAFEAGRVEEALGFLE